MKALKTLFFSLFFFWTVSLSAAGVYVPNFGSDDVSVIDVDTNQVVATIPVGSQPWTLIASLDATKLYVGNYGDGTVSVIDALTNTVTDTLTVGPGPEFFTISKDGTKVFVANSGSNTVSVIDVATDTVTNTITVGNTPIELEVSPDGQRLFVPNQASNSVSVIDVATETVVATVGGLPTAPQFITFTADSQKAFVASVTFPPNISVISNGPIPSLITTLSAGGSPGELKATPDGQRVYVANTTSNDVTVIDTATNAVIGTIAVGTNPQLVDITPDGTKVFVPNYTSNDVSVIDVASNTVIATITTGASPQGIAISPDGAYAYVANTGGNSVTVIDIATLSVIDTVTVGTGPLFIDFAANIAIGNIDVRVDGCSKDSFLSQIDLYNLIQWPYPQWDVLVFAAPVEYRIYRDAALTDLVAVVPVTEPRRFEDHNLKPKRLYSYYVTAVDQLGDVIAIGSTTVKSCKK